MYTDVTAKGYVNYTDSRIFIFSNSSISVVAHNFLLNGSGDVYTGIDLNINSFVDIKRLNIPKEFLRGNL